MPVDKFGNSDNNFNGGIFGGFSSGASLSEMNNTFIRRDGTNTATADINLDSHKLINVLDPVNDQDVVTKKYLSDSIPLPSQRFQTPYATGQNSYIWTSNQDIPPGLTESEFDSLPAGFYACYTAFLPTTRLGTLPNATKGYLIAITYQQPVDRNKYYKWIHAVTGEEWEAYFKQGVWNTWINSSKVLKTGDTMVGNLLLTTTGLNVVRELGCKTTLNGGQFALWLGPNTRLLYSDLGKYLFLQLDGGLRVTSAAGTIFDAGINPTKPKESTFHGNIDMLNNPINNVTNPTNDQDAATKNYVDSSSSNRVAKTGDTMTGNLELNVGSDTIRTLGCSDLTIGKGFSILLGNLINQIQCELNQPIKLQSSDGFLCRSSGNDIIRFGMSSTDNRVGVYQDVVMNQKFIADLALPNSNNDAANKIYVDGLAYMTAYPTMTGVSTTIDGLTYQASASNAASAWLAFQNFAADGWSAATNLDQWIQLQYPAPISMSGFYIISKAGRNITSWRVQASNNGVAFSDIVPTNNTVFNGGVLNRFNFPASNRRLFWRFFIVTSDGNCGIDMLQWIPTLTDRSLRKNNVGFVPRLTSNTNYRGFITSASSEYSANYIAANCFKGDYVSGGGFNGEWATFGVNSNFWIKITCPVTVRTWKFGFRGRDLNNERIFNWRIEASTNDLTWITLYTAPNPTFLGSTYQEFLVDSVGKFRHFRLFCVNAEGANPGLSTMQLFVYDD